MHTEKEVFVVTGKQVHLPLIAVESLLASNLEAERDRGPSQQKKQVSRTNELVKEPALVGA